MVGELQSILDVSRLEAGVYLKVMDELVSETMPKLFTEHYLENEKKALLKVKATAPWTDTIAYGHLGNDDQSNFYVAALLENRSCEAGHQSAWRELRHHRIGALASTH